MGFRTAAGYNAAFFPPMRFQTAMKNDPRQQAAQAALQRALGYTFADPALLVRALTHRSRSSQNYERLEFIGDSILDYVVALMLCEAFPALPEGRLSPLRAHLVREATLAEIARSLNIGDALLLGMGELKSGGRDRASILADVLEALFAAVSLDGGLPEAEALIRRLFAGHVRRLDTESGGKDNKSRLQEYLQAQKLPPPKYRIEAQHGEGNGARFDVSCDLGELGHTEYASASSRRAAEQQCAAQALAWLEARFRRRP